jgi:dTDP-4-dehydrorhamnose reductase
VAKAAAEVAVRAIDPAAVVVRTSLIASDGQGETCRHEQLALDLAAGRADGTLWTDAIRCPVLVTDLAAALLELASSDVAGVLNVGGAESVSFAELGRLYAAWHGVDPATVPVSTIAEAGAVRPGDVRLDTAEATRILRTPLRGLRTLLTLPGSS